MIRKRLVVAAASAALAMALTGCTDQPEPGQPAAPTGTTGGPTGTTSAPITPSVPGTTTGGGPPAPVTSASPEAPGQPPSTRCTAAVLRGTIQGGDPAAGNRYAKLLVTNTGGTTCTLYGYGGFQLVDANGRALPTSTHRDEPPGPSLVRLAPGATAAKNLHWGVVHTGNEPIGGPCQPEPSSARVIPPDETVPFTVDWRFGPVCAAGTFHDSAYYVP